MYLKNGWRPSRWMRARAAQILLNRITEDLLNTDKMREEGGELATLAEAYDQYESALEEYFRVDFAHMQKKFLDFIESPLGEHFLEGTGETVNPGLSHVLVDEYQDTNPIQEAIYLRLADREPHNIYVVGDDDQALYRFRGATVECMINFGKVCDQRWGVEVQEIQMVENYRSHPQIVDWINEYIDSFDTMRISGARVSGKPELIWSSRIEGDWSAIGILTAASKKDLGKTFAETVYGLLENEIVDYPSDCVILMRSTRESRKWAGPFADALREKGIPVYNPRSRQYLEQEEIQIALGVLLEILDPDPDYNMVPKRVREVCEIWRDAYAAVSKMNQNLAEYVAQAQAKIQSFYGGAYIRTSLQEIMYHILSFEPFRTWLDEPERTVRLGQLTRLLEAFCSTPISKYPGLSRGTLQMSRSQPGKLNWNWRQTFYFSFLTLIQEEGLNDPEDEETLYPRDTLPIMTVHQAKGLEFPFVFVSGLDEAWSPDLQHELEEDFIRFRENPSDLLSAEERAKQDMIRFYYVAYSRARYALILLARSDDLRPRESENSFISLGGKDIEWLKKHVTFLSSDT